MALRKFVAACVVLIALAAGVAPAADACSCSTHNGGPLWPAVNAVGVPTDTPLVVAASLGEDARVRLVDDADNEIAIDLVRTLNANPGCGPALQDKVFYRPHAQLAPHTRYTIQLTFTPLATGETEAGVSSASSFTTGSGARQAPPPPDVKRWLLASDVPRTGRFLTAFLGADHPEPVFVVARGNPATLVQSLGPLAYRNPMPLPLGKVDCASLELVDVTGTTIEELRLCQPEKCRTVDGIACGTCGDNCDLNTLFSGWQNAPACANAPTPDAGAAQPPSSGGCTIGGRTPAGPLGPAVPLLLGLACVIRRVRGPCGAPSAKPLRPRPVSR